jgi:DAK2 domain fusion protein YloV
VPHRYDAIVAPLERLGVRAMRDTITSYCDVVRAHAAALNRLNVYPVPDGDTGTNMASTLEAVVAELADTPGELSPTCRAIAHGSLMGARGNSGVILSQILRGLSTALEAAGELDPSAAAAALASAATSAYGAVLRPVEGTILTVVREAAAAAEHAARAGATLVEVLAAARARGDEALQRTPDLLPVLKAAGVVDAGGAGFLLLLDAALHVVDGRPVPTPAQDDGTDVLAHVPAHRADDAVADLRYEVMYFLDLADEHIEAFKRRWAGIGDSIVVVGGDGLWNCHVHTNDIGAALEAGLDDGGRPSKVTVTDLYDQVGYAQAFEHPVRPAATRCGVVAVAAGDGLTDLFRRLGVSRVVRGGRTMSPSTADLLDAVERAVAAEVVILPNDKNIVPVAEQVGGLATKRVRVVPTRSVAEAFAALVVYDGSLSVDVNAEAMATAGAGVASGEVTRAVRAAISPVGPVAAGDWLGLTDAGGIVAVADSVQEAAVALLATLVSDRHELVSVIEGVDAGAAATESILEWLADHRPDVTVEVHCGGQPLSAYVFGAE